MELRNHLESARICMTVDNFAHADFYLRRALADANKTRHPATGRIMAALSFTRRAMLARRQESLCN